MLYLQVIYLAHEGITMKLGRNEYNLNHQWQSWHLLLWWMNDPHLHTYTPPHLHAYTPTRLHTYTPSHCSALLLLLLISHKSCHSHGLRCTVQAHRRDGGTHQSMKYLKSVWVLFVQMDSLSTSGSKFSNALNVVTVNTGALLTTKQKWLHIVRN